MEDGAWVSRSTMSAPAVGVKMRSWLLDVLAELVTAGALLLVLWNLRLL